MTDAKTTPGRRRALGAQIRGALIDFEEDAFADDACQECGQVEDEETFVCGCAHCGISICENCASGALCPSCDVDAMREQG
jgi:hypothetical protein